MLPKADSGEDMADATATDPKKASDITPSLGCYALFLHTNCSEASLWSQRNPPNSANQMDE